MMKRIIIILVALVSTLTMSANNKKKAKNVESVTFNVSMHCENCQKKIEGTIGWEKGVKNLKTDLEKKTVTIKFDVRKTNKQQLQEKIQELGYDVEEVTAEEKKNESK